VSLRRQFFPVLFLCLGLVLAGCRSSRAILLTEQEEFALAQEHMSARKWDRAREHFQRVVDRYPGSALASEAILGKAESYFLGRSFAEARTEYQLFLEFYPAHEKADLALYRIGLAQSRQMRSVDRDQSPTFEAVKTFRRFLETYPNSPYLPEVQEKLVEVQQRMMRHDLYVARFYKRRNLPLGSAVRYRRILENYPLDEQERSRYQAALAEALTDFSDRRLEWVVQEYQAERWFSVVESIALVRHYLPDVQLSEQLLCYHAESLYQLERRRESRAEYETIARNFPGGTCSREAQQRIGEIDAEPTMLPSLIEGQIER
jgi:outer membrane assembly lipoprotein YfiO